MQTIFVPICDKFTLVYFVGALYNIAILKLEVQNEKSKRIR